MNLSRIKPEDLLFIDELAVTNTEVVDLLRRQGAIPRMVREWILDRTLRETPLEATFQQKLLTEYRNTQKLIDNESYAAHLQQRHIDENILLKMLSRPHQVVCYREERWGPSRKASIFNTKNASTWSHTTDLKLPTLTSCRRYISDLKIEKKAGMP